MELDDRDSWDATTEGSVRVPSVGNGQDEDTPAREVKMKAYRMMSW